MRFRKIIKLFEHGSVCVTGQRGSGKDMIISNVVARRHAAYVSNIDYSSKRCAFHPLSIQHINMYGNTYKNLLDDSVKKFTYAYPEGADIYISDIGVYFPSQYCNELNKALPGVPLFLALSRQIADCNVHLNVQNLNRAWDKFREQSDTYLTCNRCIVLFGKLVFQIITLYDRADSCQARIRPCRVPRGRGKDAKMQAAIYKDNFFNTHGNVKRRFLLYVNKSKYDTRHFKNIFAEVPQDEEKKISCVVPDPDPDPLF